MWNPRSCSLGPCRKGIRRQLGGGWAVVRFPTERKSRRERERHACLFLSECLLQSCVCVCVWTALLVRHSQPGPRLSATQRALERCGREWVWVSGGAAKPLLIRVTRLLWHPACREDVPGSLRGTEEVRLCRVAEVSSSLKVSPRLRLGCASGSSLLSF